MTPVDWYERHWCGQFFRFLHTGTLSHCEFNIYMHQHPSCTCIWSINLSVDTIFHSYWFPSRFLWSGVADNKEAIELWVPNGGPHHYFVNYTEYMSQMRTDISFVIVKILFFLSRSWLVTRFLTCATSWEGTAYPYKAQYPRFIMGFMLLNL
jgi:hypothetical protein